MPKNTFHEVVLVLSFLYLISNELNGVDIKNSVT